MKRGIGFGLIVALVAFAGLGAAYRTVSRLNDLNDVTITTPVNGAVLTYSTGAVQWIDGPAGGGAGDFMADGTVAMTGDLNMNGKNITNAGTFYTATNYVDVLIATNITFLAYDYAFIPASSFWPAATNAASAYTNQVTGADPLTQLCFSFSNLSTNRMQLTFPMPPGWKTDSTVRFKLNLSMTNTAGTNVFGIRAKGSLLNAWGTAVTLTNVMGTVAGTNILTSVSAACTPGGTITKDKLLSIEVYRDPSVTADDQVGSVEVHSVVMEYQKTNSTTALW
jgi:hypothetical protein